jgi:hypothetical protein
MKIASFQDIYIVLLTTYNINSYTVRRKYFILIKYIISFEENNDFLDIKSSSY